MKIVVGSKNPVKVRAVRKVFESYFPECAVVGEEVESGVSEQPMSELETMQGARMRADAALRQARGKPGEVEYGVGIEGGVMELKGKLFECAWVAIIAKNSKIKDQSEYIEGLGGGLYFELPEKIAKRIRKGEELGPIMVELMQYDVKRSEGAIGVFSKGKLSRQEAYEQLVTQALLKFVSPEWYV